MTSSLAGINPIATRRSVVWDQRWSLALVILLAAALRLIMLGHDTLSHDEAARAVDAWSATWARMRWYPPLQYALLWTVRHTLGASEFALRLPSAISGVACAAILFLFLRRHLNAWSGFWAALIAACHDELVWYSRLVKVFSTEALVCVAISWAGVELCRAPSRRRWMIFLACSLVGIGLTYTGSLVTISWLAVLGWTVVRSGPQRRRWLWQAVGTATLLAIAMATCYVWLSGAENRGGASREYGGTYGGWPVDYHARTLAEWFVAQSFGALQYVLGIAHLYSPIDWLIGSLELLLAAVALKTLRTRMPEFCAAAVLLLIVTIAASALKIWPFGKFHTVMFLIPLVCVAIGCGLREMIARFGVSAPTVLLVLVVVLNPAARAAKNSIFDPIEHEHLRPVLEYVDRQVLPGDGLFAYYGTTTIVQHYWQRTDIDVLMQPTDDRDRIELFSERFARFMSEHGRVWFVFTHDTNNEREEWIGRLKRDYELVDEFAIADASGHLLIPRTVER